MGVHIHWHLLIYNEFLAMARAFPEKELKLILNGSGGGHIEDAVQRVLLSWSAAEVKDAADAIRNSYEPYTAYRLIGKTKP